MTDEKFTTAEDYRAWINSLPAVVACGPLDRGETMRLLKMGAGFSAVISPVTGSQLYYSNCKLRGEDGRLLSEITGQCGMASNGRRAVCWRHS